MEDGIVEHQPQEHHEQEHHEQEHHESTESPRVRSRRMNVRELRGMFHRSIIPNISTSTIMMASITIKDSWSSLMNSNRTTKIEKQTTRNCFKFLSTKLIYTLQKGLMKL